MTSTDGVAVTGPEPGPGWQQIRPDRWYSSDGRYVLLQLDPPSRRGLLTRLRSAFTTPRPPAGLVPGVPPAVTAAVEAAQPVSQLFTGPVVWAPDTADVGPGSAWLGRDRAGRDVVLQTSSVSTAGHVRVHHGLLVGRTGGGKSVTLQNLLLPGLRAGTELVLVADGLGDSVPLLRPYLSRHACRQPSDIPPNGWPVSGEAKGQRWAQVIAVAWRILRSRQVRGWDGPTTGDPLVTLVISEPSLIKDSIGGPAESAFVEIARAGEGLGVRTIQTVFSPATANLLGERDWLANTRWTIGHAVATGFDSGLATQSTDEDVSLIGLRAGHAAVIAEGQVLTPDTTIPALTEAAIGEAMNGVSAAHLHPQDLQVVGSLWETTADWSTGQEAGSDE